MAGLALSGLASGFDWKGIVDQLIEVSRAPQNRLRREKTELATRTTALNEVKSAVATLKSSVGSLGSETALLKKAASIANPDSRWKATAGTNATPGEYSFQLLQTATAAVVRGKKIGQTTPVVGGSLPYLQDAPAGRPFASGTFTVGGHVIPVDITTDTYSSIASKIVQRTQGTSNPYSAYYDAATDKFTILSIAVPPQDILLGSGSDTSNFLQLMDLSSTTLIGQNRTSGRDLPLASNQRLRDAGIDSGWININGEDIYVDRNSRLSNFIGQIQSAPGISDARISGSRLLLDSAGALTVSLPNPAPDDDENGTPDPVSNVLHVLGLISNDENNVAPTNSYGLAVDFAPGIVGGPPIPAQVTSGTLGKVNLTASLANANLGTALNGPTTGSFYVNGTEIEYDTTQDSIQAILNRITSSSAGVLASYDLANDAIILTNKNTGQVETFVTTENPVDADNDGAADGGDADDAGLVDALFGLAAGSSPGRAGFLTLVAGRNAAFSLNGGGILTSRSNIFNETVHGISGLEIDASAQSSISQAAGDAPVTEKITVKGDPSAARDAVNTFITNYNALQAVIEKHTKVTYSDGKVTTGVLAGSREMADVSRTLRQELFRNIGFSGSIQRLSDMGVTSSGIENVISLSNSALLESKINTDASGVLDYFGNSTNGLITRLNRLLGDSSTDVSAASGKIGIQLTTIQKQNTSLDKQIAEFERRLESQRQLMESSFIAMERAQSKFQQQSSYLQRTFASNNK
jgi:flagellar capping protein FliD